jgi:galactokinase
MPTESRREPLDAAGCLCSGELLTARVPGRIDLLGAHTVYNGFPVLSMAVNRNITARFSPVQEATRTETGETRSRPQSRACSISTVERERQ